LPSDVEYMASHGVVLVMNMCREYEGPLDGYDLHGIKQHWFPTPDLSEPSRKDVDEAISFIEELKIENPDAVVFVHCKGGRGRAVTVAMCYLLKQGMSAQRAGDLIQEQRSIANVSAVLKYEIVQSFIREFSSLTSSSSSSSSSK
jgi:atypical dual specificity phosphatase